MRINRFVALATGISRRKADELIVAGKILVNDRVAGLATKVNSSDTIKMDGKILHAQQYVTILLNKPVGYVCSRQGQGSKTVYDLLPSDLYNLKPVGRLDKESSGLLVMTNNGDLAQNLTHPSAQKDKVYTVTLTKDLTTSKKNQIEEGVTLEDGKSKLELSGEGKHWTVTIHEGRNRQIRRTFSAVGNNVIMLHRQKFGPYELNDIKEGMFITIE